MGGTREAVPDILVAVSGIPNAANQQGAETTRPRLYGQGQHAFRVFPIFSFFTPRRWISAPPQVGHLIGFDICYSLLIPIGS